MCITIHTLERERRAGAMKEEWKAPLTGRRLARRAPAVGLACFSTISIVFVSPLSARCSGAR